MNNKYITKYYDIHNNEITEKQYLERDLNEDLIIFEAFEEVTNEKGEVVYTERGFRSSLSGQ